MKTWETSLKCSSKQVVENEKHVCKKNAMQFAKNVKRLSWKQSSKRCPNIGKWTYLQLLETIHFAKKQRLETPNKIWKWVAMNWFTKQFVCDDEVKTLSTNDS